MTNDYDVIWQYQLILKETLWADIDKFSEWSPAY